MDLQEAKEKIVSQATDNEGSLDKAADQLIERIGAFFGECTRNEDFCGLAIDESRDCDGQLLSIKLTACDIVGGDPVRREGRFVLAKPEPKLQLVQ